MPMQATPQNLAQIWQLPEGAFLQGMRQFEQMQEMDSQKMAADAAAEAYRAQERPLTLEQLAGQNRARDAQLPGLKANSRIAVNKAEMSDNIFDSDLEAYFAQNRGKIQKEQFESALRAGPLLLQFAEMAAYNPQSIPQIRQRMIDMGVGDAWNPEWDKANPRDVAAGMYDFGTSLSNATPAMQKLMAQLESKESIAAERNATQLTLQEQRAALGRELARLRAGGKNTPKASAQRLEALLTQAYQSGDMESAAQIAETMRFVRGRDEVKPQVDTTQVPILKPPTPAVNPLKKQESKPDPLGIR